MRTVLAAAVLAALLSACQPAGPTDPATAANPAVPAKSDDGVSAPDATGAADDAGKPERPTLQVSALDGTAFDLAAHRGKWVVVNFWATWCAPCLKEMPELSALDAMHEHIDVVGLAYEDIDVAAMTEFLVKHPVLYPIAIVDPFDPPADFDTPRGLPMTYLIAPDGRVARKVLGPVTAAEIETAIAANGGPAAAPAEGAS